MPVSRFLVQTDEFAFQELIQESTLPFFITDLAADGVKMARGRVSIPITDPEANVTYYFICRKDNKKYRLLVDQLIARKPLIHRND